MPSRYLLVLFCSISNIYLNLLPSLSSRKGIFFFIMEFQWFLVWLSVRPGSFLDISAHLFPCTLCNKNSIHYYSYDHSSLFIDGSKWLNHRYRHCFPWRSGKYLAICVQFLGPILPTKSTISWSSSLSHGFLMSLGFDVCDGFWRDGCGEISWWLNLLELEGIIILNFR